MIIIEKYIEPENLSGYVFFEDIDCCPMCNYKISPIYIAGKSHSDEEKFSLYCECPSCGNPFIVYFKTLLPRNGSLNFDARNIEYLAPIFPKTHTFDEKVVELSSNFVETYNQSLSAETYNLNQIAGMGYRKALEFLIKDYCIYKYPNDKEKILSMLLGQCISTYIEDDNIQKLSKVSVWLGNDETHYIKKFEDKDINDLKRFINAVVYFILYNLNIEEADNIINSQ